MALESDVQSPPGPEEIKLERFFEGIYRCFVHSYSGELLEGSSAEVELAFNGSVLSVTCPRNSSGHWWHVFDWDTRDEALTVVGRLTEDEPTT
jgi:hypothetical protein